MPKALYTIDEPGQLRAGNKRYSTGVFKMKVKLDDYCVVNVFITQYYDSESTLLYSGVWETKFYNKTHTKSRSKAGTEVKIIMPNDTEEYVGEARLDSRDHFNRETGRKIAGRKAIDKLKEIYDLTDSDILKIWAVLLPKYVKIAEHQ